MERILLKYEENEWNDELSAEYVGGPADMISKEEVRQAILLFFLPGGTAVHPGTPGSTVV